MNDSFGEFIKEQRKKNSLTQKELAKQLNISDKAISKWEVGDSYPDISLLRPLAKVFNLTVDELLSCKINIKEKKNEITKNLMIANIAVNMVLIIIIIVFFIISLFGESSNAVESLVLMSSPEIQTGISMIVLLGISISFIAYSLLQYKKLGSEKKNEKSHLE